MDILELPYDLWEAARKIVRHEHAGVGVRSAWKSGPQGEIILLLQIRSLPAST